MSSVLHSSINSQSAPDPDSHPLSHPFLFVTPKCSLYSAKSPSVHADLDSWPHYLALGRRILSSGSDLK